MSAGRVCIRQAAQHDLDALVDYLLREAGAETAGRFVEQARASFMALAGTPGMGSAVPVRSPALAGMRKWRVSGFPRFLIFYLPLDDGVRIIRVFHAAADWWSLLDVN